MTPFRVWTETWIREREADWRKLLTEYRNGNCDARLNDSLLSELCDLVHPGNGAVFVAVNEFGAIAGYISVRLGRNATITQWHQDGRVADIRDLYRMLLEAVKSLCASLPLEAPELVWNSRQFDHSGRIGGKAHERLTRMGFEPSHATYTLKLK